MIKKKDKKLHVLPYNIKQSYVMNPPIEKNLPPYSQVASMGSFVTVLVMK